VGRWQIRADRVTGRLLYWKYGYREKLGRQAMDM
jgi:hypothetical protein